MHDESMVRVRPELLAEIRRFAEAEGIPVERFVNAAVAEKLSAMWTGTYFAERAARGDVEKALEVLDRIGSDEPPMPGDEIPDDRGAGKPSSG